MVSRSGRYKGLPDWWSSSRGADKQKRRRGEERARKPCAGRE